MLHRNSFSSSQMRSSHLDSQGIPVQHTPPHAPLPHGPAVTCTQLSGGKCQGAASHTRDQILNSHRARSSAHPRAQNGINGLYMSLEVHGEIRHSLGTHTLRERKNAQPCFLKWSCSASLRVMRQRCVQRHPFTTFVPREVHTLFRKETPSGGKN